MRNTIKARTADLVTWLPKVGPTDCRLASAGSTPSSSARSATSGVLRRRVELGGLHPDPGATDLLDLGTAEAERRSTTARTSATDTPFGLANSMRVPPLKSTLEIEAQEDQREQ